MSSVFAPPPPQKKISFTGFNSKSHFPSLHVSSKDLQHFTKNLATLRVWAFGHLILVFSLSITKKKQTQKVAESRCIIQLKYMYIHVLGTHLNADLCQGNLFLFLTLVDIIYICMKLDWLIYISPHKDTKDGKPSSIFRIHMYMYMYTCTLITKNTAISEGSVVAAIFRHC